MKNLFFSIFLLLYFSSAFASKDKCELTDSSAQNLSTLLNWCEHHHITDDQCTELLDASSELTPTEFEKRLTQFENNLKPKKADSGSATADDSFDIIPKKPKEALRKLQISASSDDNKFFKKVDFHKNAQKYFDTLTPAEIRNVYEVVEKIKTSPNKAELIKSLQNKDIESLGNKETKACNRPHAMAVRLSRSARMCFQIEDGQINILCIGQGVICYNH